MSTLCVYIDMSFLFYINLFSPIAFASGQAHLLKGHSIYSDMRKNSRVRGYAIAGSILEVHEVRQGLNCSRGWAVVDGGYLCLEETQWSTDTTASSSSFLEWDVPTPNPDTETYRVTDWKPEEFLTP